MKKFSGPLSRRYGTALFESVKNQKNVDTKEFVARVANEAKLFIKHLQKEAIPLFINPLLNLSEKNKLLDSYLQVLGNGNEFSREMVSFLKLLIANDRFQVVAPILGFFLKKAEEFLGVVEAVIVSPRPLSDAEMHEFQSALAQVLNKKIIFSNEIDPSLLSGFVIKLGNVVVDASLKLRLSNLKEFIV